MARFDRCDLTRRRAISGNIPRKSGPFANAIGCIFTGDKNAGLNKVKHKNYIISPLIKDQT